MKIIKKLCIPLFSLVLVLGCFAVSQMDGSAYTSSFVCTTHRVYMYLSHCTVVPNGQLANGVYLYSHVHVYNCPAGGCYRSYSLTESLEANQPCVGGVVPSHTHNYSTVWGEWKKISETQQASQIKRYIIINLTTEL